MTNSITNLWGQLDEVMALAERIQVMHPDGHKYTTEQRMGIAQYALLTNTNLFNGEIVFGFDEAGRFFLDDGYRGLVNYAKKQGNYTEDYDQLTTAEKEAEGLTDYDIVYRCTILRDDRADQFTTLLIAYLDHMGYEEAKQAAYNSAGSAELGIVMFEETYDEETQTPITSPEKSWHVVARRRALKAALRRSHGSPSPVERAESSWLVNGVKTVPEDWEAIPAHIQGDSRQRYVAQKATKRNHHVTPEALRRTRADRIRLLRGSLEEGID